MIHGYNTNIYLNQIYCSDFSDFFELFPDDFFQCILIDPPYGLNKKNREKGEESYDDTQVGFEGDWFNQAFRTLSSLGTMFITFNTIESYLLIKEHFPIPYRDFIIWDKRGSKSYSALHPRKNTHNLRAEVIYGFVKNEKERIWHPSWKTEFLRHLSNGVGSIKNHPSPKPVGLYKKLISAVCDDKDHIVCDPAAGSGTTGVSARSLDFKWVMGDNNLSYVDDMKERLSHKIDPYFPQESYKKKGKRLF